MRKLVILSCFFSVFAFCEDMSDFENEFKEKEVFDPLSGYNRFMTGFNDIVWDYAFTPVLQGYDYIMPDPIQGAFSNFFHNVLYPVRLVNNLLQGKFSNSWDETKRFLINTTIGFAGMSDAASMHFNIPRHDEDFGQTLGYWGIPTGPHIVWPIIGPSNLRDTFGLVGDYFSNPVNYIEDDATRIGVSVGYRLNDFSIDPLFYRNLKKDAVDLYPFLRDTYEQRRNYLIKE